MLLKKFHFKEKYYEVSAMNFFWNMKVRIDQRISFVATYVKMAKINYNIIHEW